MAEEAIGRADYVLGADNSGVKAAVAESEQLIKQSGAQTEAQYSSTAYKAGVVIGKGILGGVRILSAGASAAFAIATKGSIDLTNAQIEFQRETGASADEAARAGKAINAMSGRNVQDIGEIGATLAKVRTNLGLVGDEGEKTTEVFLRYARVTKQDATGAVVAFDDILDAWNLTAADAQGLMDKLIVSHQKYGGSIEENQRVLAQLAPQLRALNLSLDDGIGLLNLFASSGLDATVMQRALNAAIQNLPKGTSLQDYIAQLSKIEDPAQRAAKASEIFGSRAGPALANAIKPGVASLDRYKVSIDEAAGATDRANDVLDSSFGGQIQKKIREVGAAIRSIGQDWGPAITGAGSLVTAITAIGGDDVAKKIIVAVGGPIASAFKAAGQKAADSLSDGFDSVLSGAEGTVLGNNIASRVENIFDPEKNTLLGRAARGGAAKVALVWGAALGAASALGSAITGAVAAAFNALPIAGAVRAAVLASAIQLGTLSGTTFGQAFGKALPVAFVVGLAAVAPEIEQITSSWAKQIHDGLFPGGGPLDDLGAAWKRWRADTPWPLGQKDAPDWASLGNDPAPAAAATKVGGSFLTALAKAAAAGAGEVILSVRLGTEHAGDAMVAAWHANQRVVHGALESFIGKVKDDLAGAGFAAAARRQANLLMGTWAQTIRNGRDATDQAWQDMLQGIKDSQSVTARTAQLLGRLASKKLIEGMHDADPAVRDQARYTKQITLDELAQLKPRAGTLSKEAWKALRAAMNSSDSDIRAAARRIYAAVHDPIAPLVPAASRWGSNIGQNIADALDGKRHVVHAAAQRLAGAMANVLQVNSPAKEGPLSLGGGPEGWGDRFGMLYAKGLRGQHAAIAAALNDASGVVARLSLASAPQPFLAGVVATNPRATGSTSTSYRAGDVNIGAIHLHGVGSDVTPAAASRFGQRVLDEIATGFRQQGARRGIHPAVTP